LEFGGVLHECRPTCRRRVDDRGRVPHAGQPCADKRLGSLQTVVGMVGASSWQIHGRKNPKPQIPNPKSQFGANALGVGTWDLGFGIWDLGFLVPAYLTRRRAAR